MHDHFTRLEKLRTENGGGTPVRISAPRIQIKPYSRAAAATAVRVETEDIIIEITDGCDGKRESKQSA